MKIIKRIVLYSIHIYRKYLSPLKLQSCRFYPSCSEYAITAVERFGVIQGLCMAVRRILKCHPFNPGGYDPVRNNGSNKGDRR